MSASYRSLAEAVEACASPGTNRFVFHLEGGPVGRSAAELVERARARARILLSRGLAPGEPIGVLGPNSPEWVEWAFAVWLAGGALLPIPYPLRIRSQELFALQLAAMASSTDCRLVVTHERFLPLLPLGLGLPWDVRLEDGPSSGPDPAPGPDDPAVIQLTSGATTRPRAALLTHGAVLAAMDSHRAHHGYVEGEDVGVSWLPFFHDNGLFGHVLLPFLNRGHSHVIPTGLFARNPASWFRVASESGATITSGPASSWAVALAAALRQPDGIDLSRLRFAVLTAESIDPATVDALAARGPELGLKPDALAGGYGLAEATLGVTTGRPGEGIALDEVDRDALTARGMAEPAGDGPARRVASCGFPLPGTQVRIASADGGEAADREVGEILVRGPSLMLRYVGRDTASPFADGWLRTGDLGYTVEGELFVTGRLKEVIVSYGRNYNPEDIERSANRLPEVRVGRVVAFGPPEEPDGPVVVAFEPTSEGASAETASLVRRAVADATGLTPRSVLALPKGFLPRTTSGKPQRIAVREAWGRGELAAAALASDPPEGTVDVDGAASVRDS